MGAKTRSQTQSDREKWDKILNASVKMIQIQQEQLHTLFQQRKLLQDHIKMQHHRFDSDIRLYQDHISLIKGELEAQRMACALQAAKSDMMMGLKLREAYIYGLKLERTDDELADFKLLFDILSNNPKINSMETDNGKKGGRNSVKSASSEKLAGEVIRLTLEYEKLASEKESEVSALVAEKKFVWNQYTVLENNLTDKLKSKEAEVEGANEKISALHANIELLQSSNNEKDEIIVRLTTKVSEMEADTNKWNEEISRLSRELELLTKSRSASVTPVLRHHTERAKSSNLGGKNSGRDRSNIVAKKESSAVQVSDPMKDSEKGSRTLKRKTVDVVTIPETPKLFSSAFKVPKLKISTSAAR